jgi:molybdate transport system substrate-binding protein
MSPQKTILSVMSALAVEVAFRRWIVPAFEAETDYRVDISWDPTTVLVQRIGKGERADVIIAIDHSMDKLANDGIIRPESRIPIAQARLGLAVKAGAPHPDISTLDAFKQALMDAESIAYSKGGASGIYFTELIGRLGIADIVAAKAVTISAGFTAEKVAIGEAQVAVQQISELMTVDGVDVIGPFPDEVQVTTEFSAATFAEADNPQGAAAFLEMLASRQADVAYLNGGLVSRLTAKA